MTPDTPAIDYSQLADLYDSFVRFDADLAFFREEAKQAGGPVLDLMAGTGRVSIPLLLEGVTLTCVDACEEMLAVLRRKLARRRLSATVLRQDIRDLHLPHPFALAFISFNGFGELLSAADRRRALASVHAALRPGSRLICPLHNPVVRLRTLTDGPRVLGPFPRIEGGGTVRLRCDFALSRASGLVEGRETLELFDETGAACGERTVPVRFALIEREELEALAEGAGFRVEAVYGDYARAPYARETSPYMVCMLERPWRRRE